MTRYSFFALLLSLSTVAAAHPDHPHTLGFADSWGHLFTSPDHLLLLLLPVAAAMLFGRTLLQWLRNRNR
jgi:hypothetical protein